MSDLRSSGSSSRSSSPGRSWAADSATSSWRRPARCGAPPPRSWSQATSGSATLDSLYSLSVGFGISAVVGIGLGYLMGWYKPVAKVMDPFVNAFYVIPVAALVPVIIIWFGLADTSRIIVVIMFCVFEILVSTYTGVRNVDPMLIDVGRSFGAGRFDLFRKVVFFASLPYIFAGLRMGVSRAIKGMVVAELLFAVTGLGGEIQTAANYYRTDIVFVYVLVIALLGVLMAGLIQLIERLVTPWRQERSV